MEVQNKRFKERQKRENSLLSKTLAEQLGKMELFAAAPLS